MRLCDRYTFAEMLLPFFIGTSAVLMMMVGTTLYDLLPALLQYHLPLKVVVRVCILAIPQVMVQALPVATALAVSLATNRMARDNEFTVLRSIGTPLIRVFVSMFFFGLLVSGLDYYIADQVTPWAVREQQNLTAYVFNNLGSDPTEAAMSFKQDNYTISFASARKLPDGRRELTNVIIVTAPKQPPSGPVPTPTLPINEYSEITTAQKADYGNGVWTLTNVVHHHYGSDGMAQYDVAAPTGTFRLTVDFSAIGSPLRPGQEDNYSTEELKQREQNAQRMGNFREARAFQVAREFKLSFALMCFSISVCCPPLCLRFARSGAFTGVLLSIVTCFVAWNTLIPLRLLAMGNYVPTYAAAWLTNIVFAGVGLWLFRIQE